MIQLICFERSKILFNEWGMNISKVCIIKKIATLLIPFSLTITFLKHFIPKYSSTWRSLHRTRYSTVNCASFTKNFNWKEIIAWSIFVKSLTAFKNISNVLNSFFQSNFFQEVISTKRTCCQETLETCNDRRLFASRWTKKFATLIQLTIVIVTCNFSNLSPYNYTSRIT